MQNNCRDVTAFLTTRKGAFFDGSFVVEMKSVLLLSPYNYLHVQSLKFDFCELNIPSKENSHLFVAQLQIVQPGHFL